jgi:peptide deformylase
VSMKIIAYPHSTLRHVSKPVRKVDAELRSMIQEMFELMYAAKGIGLAANQVNLPLRFFVMNLTGIKGTGEELVYLNPVLSHPKGSEESEEGCLSLPGLYGQVMRPKQIRVQAYNLQGEEINQELNGLHARCVQHEVDHLDGVLFTDRMAPLARQQFEDHFYEFEADFQAQRSIGAIGDEQQLAVERNSFESRYC